MCRDVSESYRGRGCTECLFIMMAALLRVCLVKEKFNLYIVMIYYFMLFSKISLHFFNIKVQFML